VIDTIKEAKGRQYARAELRVKLLNDQLHPSAEATAEREAAARAEHAARVDAEYRATHGGRGPNDPARKPRSNSDPEVTERAEAVLGVLRQGGHLPLRAQP
jgi:hypothetical protein